jgi:translation initiation factor IF-3
VKVNRIKEFLGKGLKTKLTMKFKRRQIAHKDIGLNKMNELIAALVEEGVATVDRKPTFEGRNLVAFLTPPKE